MKVISSHAIFNDPQSRDVEVNLMRDLEACHDESGSVDPEALVEVRLSDAPSLDN